MNVSAAAIKRLRSKNAQHYGYDGPMLTIVHTSDSGGALATTGRLIAETSHELALIVHGSPVVISTRRIKSRSEHGGSGLPTFDRLMRSLLSHPSRSV